MTQFGEISTVVSAIAASAKEQATALHEVNTAINQMDQVTQQNAAMVEQSTAASHSLAEESETLSTLVGGFTFGPQSHAPAERQRPVARPAAAARPPARVAKRPPAPAAARPALKVVGSGKDEGWEEF
jgi:methyl-accepting chemotaxis protein